MDLLSSSVQIALQVLHYSQFRYVSVRVGVKLNDLGVYGIYVIYVCTGSTSIRVASDACSKKTTSMFYKKRTPTSRNVSKVNM